MHTNDKAVIENQNLSFLTAYPVTGLLRVPMDGCFHGATTSKETMRTCYGVLLLSFLCLLYIACRLRKQDYGRCGVYLYLSVGNFQTRMAEKGVKKRPQNINNSKK